MGRNLQGNITKSKLTKLTTQLGSASSTQVDALTKRKQYIGSVLPYTTTDTQKFKNTLGEQANGTTSGPFVLQDEFKPYNLINTYTSGGYKLVLLDDDLNVLDLSAMTMYSNVAVRLYDGKIYQFNADSTNLLIYEYDIASKTNTSYSFAHGLATGSLVLKVFNWPVVGKFHVLLVTYGSLASKAKYMTFDASSKAIASPSQTYTSGSTTQFYYGTIYGFHVKDDGSAVSVLAYLSEPSTGGANDVFGVIVLSPSTASFSGASPNYHITWSGFGNSWQLTDPGIVVTRDCIVNPTLGFGGSGNPYYSFVMHLRGGDTAVQGTQFSSTSGAYPVGGITPLPTRHNQYLIGANLASGGSGIYSITRSGTSVVFTYYCAALPYGNHIPCQLAESFAGINYAGSAGSIYLSQICLGTSDSYTGNWTFHAQVPGVNDVQYGSASAGGMSFVTRKGKLFTLGTLKSSTATSTYYVTTSLTYISSSYDVSYSASVIGGGGAAAATGHGTSSSFAGLFVAAAGAQRNGGNAGSQIITSGSLRGTGGVGYFDEKYGSGEDAGAAGTYGGGSGYLAVGTLSVSAGEVVPYSVGFAPAYGAQGAIVLQEV